MIKTWNWKRTLLVGALIVTLPLTQASSCDDSHDSAPDPTPGTFQNIQNMRGFKAPDGYRNILVFCDGPNMVYETSRGGTGAAAEGTTSTLAVVPNDPRCAK